MTWTTIADLLVDLLTSDAVRYFIAAEMAVLLGVTVFLHTLYGAALPRPLLLMGRGLLWVVSVVAIAVIVNALSPLPLTPGAWIVAAGTLPVVARGLRLVACAVRTARADHPHP